MHDFGILYMECKFLEHTHVLVNIWLHYIAFMHRVTLCYIALHCVTLCFSLISQCESNPMLKSSVMGFIENVTRLIALLLDYRHVPADDANRGRRMGCMLNLLVSEGGREGRGREGGRGEGEGGREGGGRGREGGGREREGRREGGLGS